VLTVVLTKDARFRHQSLILIQKNPYPREDMVTAEANLLAGNTTSKKLSATTMIKIHLILAPDVTVPLQLLLLLRTKLNGPRRSPMMSIISHSAMGK
jgi:hypothetical protein